MILNLKKIMKRIFLLHVSCVTRGHLTCLHQDKDGISHTNKGEEDEKELFEDCSSAYRSYALGGFLLTGSKGSRE